ncbi:hypothetical protein [Leisingera sp. S232]|uniref:hypothetical protein n=1 Tax=Leisingera sp. S232 TaxID=3415132 RepID=UPI003C7C6B98
MLACDKNREVRFPKTMRISLGILFLAVVAPTALLAGEFSDQQDRRAAAWILEALGRDYSGIETDLAKLKLQVAKPADLKTVTVAFSRLQTCRTDTRYYDNPLPLVAAEHHAYIRYLASESGDTKLSAAPQAYYDAKIELQNQGKLDWLRTTDQAVSAPSKSVVEWAVFGVQYGLIEYRERTGNNPVPGTVADGLIKQLSLGMTSKFFSWATRAFFDYSKYSRANGVKCAIVDPSERHDSLK